MALVEHGWKNDVRKSSPNERAQNNERPGGCNPLILLHCESGGAEVSGGLGSMCCCGGWAAEEAQRKRDHKCTTINHCLGLRKHKRPGVAIMKAQVRSDAKHKAPIQDDHHDNNFAAKALVQWKTSTLCSIHTQNIHNKHCKTTTPT